VPKQLYGNKIIENLVWQHAWSLLSNISAAVVLLLYAAAWRAVRGRTTAVAADKRLKIGYICFSTYQHDDAGV
jgi:hypothetical protein